MDNRLPPPVDPEIFRFRHHQRLLVPESADQTRTNGSALERPGPVSGNTELVASNGDVLLAGQNPRYCAKSIGSMAAAKSAPAPSRHSVRKVLMVQGFKTAMEKPRWQPGEENIPKELRSHNGSGMQEAPDSRKRKSVRERMIGDVELYGSAASAKRRKEELDGLLKTKAYRSGKGWDEYTEPHASTDGDESGFEAAISDEATSSPDEGLPDTVTPSFMAQDTVAETTDHPGPLNEGMLLNELDEASMETGEEDVEIESDQISSGEIEKALKLLEDYHSVLPLILSTWASGVDGPGNELPEATIEMVPYNIEEKCCDVLDEIFGDQLRGPKLEAVLEQPYTALPKLKDGLDIVCDHLMQAVEEKVPIWLPWSPVESHSKETWENMAFDDWDLEYLTESWKRMMEELEEALQG
ncbi:hypothetical protein LTR86_009659 [Recurvomyces mirabilis]|nr:hypothetical protein LTR86_009659 [Recurvomyces mirabilis]